MRARPVLAGLLIIALMMMATTVGRGRTHPTQDDPPSETKETPNLTLDEELEARQIAEQFIRRFEDSDDLLSIVDDLYVRDFNDRLSHNVADRFLVPVDSELALQVKGDELRRYHIAALKFMYLYILIVQGKHIAHKGVGEEEDDEKDLDAAEVLPPRAIDLLKNDPAFAGMILESSRKKAEEQGEQEAVGVETEKKVEEKDETIRDIERLRSLVHVMEQAVVILREHLQTLPIPHTWQGLVDFMREPGQEPLIDRMRPSPFTLINDDFGSPKGTRLICLDVLIFHMHLLRVDGQLKILNVYMADD